jgi:hypothetical protein
MSSLEWVEAPHTSYTKPPVLTMYWELWVVGEDQTAWYNMPCAQIRKLKERQWELTFPDRNLLPTQCFTTLKAAKAMGIALVRMDDAI